MIKVSVIIPFYKVERYVAQCLESVINQTLADIEILCIDDQSPDNSIDIIREYAEKDSRIHIFRHEQNKGPGGARNTGIANARGEYIFFLDSDDWLLEDGLEQLYEAAKKHNVKVVSAPFKRYVEASDSYKRTRIKEKGLFRFTNNNFASLEYNVFKLYHMSIFQDLDIRFPDLSIHEDVEFYWKVFSVHNCIYCLEKPVMVYRIRVGSIMNSKRNDDYYDNNIALIKNIFIYLKKKNLLDTYRQAFNREYYHCYYMGSTFDAEKFSGELEPFFRENNFRLGFSKRRIRKWFYDKKFNQNERTLRLFGIYLMKTKL